jgi:Fe-S cluster assembly protein SufD
VVSSLTFTFATGTVRNNSTLVPAGEGCESHLGGLYICHGEQHVDTSTLVDHVAPGCMSNELFKGIVYDRSTGVFNGKVFVRRAAQQTNAYQQSQGVILSPDAHHFSKPELEIYADDVKCSHGSTTGSIDVEALFYLRSRGISESDARAMLLYAFAHDVVEMVSDEALRTHLDARIAERLT